MKRISVLIMVLAVSITANSAMEITEWMYNPSSSSGELIEFTNTGSTSVNMTGWILSSVGDSYGSYASTAAIIGNLGVTSIPEPATMILLGLGGLLFVGKRRM